MQVLTLVLGECGPGPFIILPINTRPKLTYQMMLDSEKCMYESNTGYIYQQCDKHLVTK